MADNKNTPQVSKRVLDFSPVSFNTGMEGSQYKRDLSPFEKSQDVLAASQGFWDASGNFLANIVGSTAINTAGLGASLYGIGKAIGTGEFKDIWDNELAQGLDKVQKGLDEMTPFYNSEKEDKAGLFTADYLTSAGFWGNTVGKGISFIAGAYLGGAGLAKAGSTALKGLSKASKSFGKLVAGEEATSGLISAAKQGNIPGWIERAGKSSTIRNAASYYAQKISGNMFEAGMEARGVKEEILRAKTEEYAKQNPNAPEPPEWLKKQWDEDSNVFGNVAMGLNLLLLQTDGIGLGKTMYGYKTTKRTIEAARDAAGKYVELSAKRKILNKAGRVLSGGLEEGAQEGGQFIVEKTSVDLGTNDKAKSFADYVNAGFKGLEQTLGTKEGQESMLAGFLLGGGGRGIGELRGSAERNIMNKAGIEALNKFMLKDTVKPLVDLAGKSFDEGNGQVLENATEVNDKKLFLDAKAKDFFNWASTRIEMGRYEDAVEELQQLKNTPVEILDQIFPNHGLSESKKHQMFDGLLNDMRELNRMQSDVEINFGNSPYKKNILNTAYKIKNIDRRIQEMSTKEKSMLDIYHDEDLQNLLAEKEELSRDLAILMMTRPAPSKNTQEEKTSEDNKDANKALTPTNNTPTQTPSDIVSKQERKENIVGTKIPGMGVITNINNGVATIKDENGVVTHEELDNLPNGSYEEKVFTPEPSEQDEETVMVPDYAHPETRKKDVSFVDPSVNTEDPNYQFSGREEFVQASDFGFLNYDKIPANEVSGALSPEDAALVPQLDAIKQGIMDKGLNFEDYDFLYSKDDKTGYTSVILKNKKDGTTIKGGHITNINIQLAGNAKNGSKRSILQFMTDYFNKLAGTNRRKNKNSFIPVIQGIRSLLEKAGLKITDYIRPHSRIRGGVTPLSEVMQSPRFLVNGHLAMAFFKDGVYQPDKSLPKDLQETIKRELEKPYNQNNLGTQYVLMVERPGQPGVYTFVGVKGRKLNSDEIQAYATKIAENPQNLAASLNRDIFIPSAGEQIQGSDGKMYPVHYEFDKYEEVNESGQVIKAGKLYVKRFIKGTIDNSPIKDKRRSTMSIQEALERASVKISSDVDEAFTPESLEKLQVNTDPQLFDLYFQFNAKKFLAEHPLEFNQDDALNKAQQEAEQQKNSKVAEVERQLEALKEKNFQIVDGKYQNIDDITDEYDRVSSLKGKGEFSNEEAANRGTIIDSLLRDFIADKIVTLQDLKKAYYSHEKQPFANTFNNKFLQELFDVFVELRKTSGNIKLISDIPTLWGEINGAKIAGTIDLLGINDKGEVFIIDLKTSSQDRRLQYKITNKLKELAGPLYEDIKGKIKQINETRKGGFAFGPDIKTLFTEKEVAVLSNLASNFKNSIITDPDTGERKFPIYFYADDDVIQQSAYAELLRQRTGITVKSVSVLPLRTTVIKSEDSNERVYNSVITSKDDNGRLTLKVDLDKNIFPDNPNIKPQGPVSQTSDGKSNWSKDLSFIKEELNKLSTKEQKLQWLADNKYLEPFAEKGVSSNYLKNATGRVIVKIKIGNITIPFYISTGQGGKTDVEVDKWYVFFGQGSNGWFNKTSGSDINKQYGVKVFQDIANILNEVGSKGSEYKVHEDSKGFLNLNWIASVEEQLKTVIDFITPVQPAIINGELRATPEDIAQLKENIQTVKDRVAAELSEKPVSEETTEQPGTLEDKKADIEKRRREELKNNIYPATKTGSNRDKYGRGQDIYEINGKSYFVDYKKGEKIPTIYKEDPDKINAEYDAEYVDAVKKGEMTREQAMQFLEEVGRKNSKAYAELAALESSSSTSNIETLIIGKAKIIKNNDGTYAVLDESDEVYLEGGTLEEAQEVAKSLNEVDFDDLNNQGIDKGKNDLGPDGKAKLLKEIEDKDPVEKEKILREVAVFEKELARILPGIKVNVDFTKGFSYYRNAVITLTSSQVSQAKWHEAFHAIFDCFSPEEKNRAIRIAAENFAIDPTELLMYKNFYDDLYNRDLALFQSGQISKEPKKLTEEELIRIMYEEKIADLFQDYMENRPVERGLFQRFFDAIARFIMHLLGRTDETPFAALFDSINKGDFANRNPNLGEENVRMKLPNSTSSQSRQLVANLGVQTIKALQEDPRMEVAPFIKGQIEKYRALYSNNVNSKIKELKKQVILKKITQEQYVEQIRILTNTRQIIDDKNLYPPMLAADNESLIIDAVKKFSNLIDKYEVELEENDEDNIETIKNLSLMESNMDELIEAQAVQQRISYLHYLDENGMVTAVDAKPLYDNLKMNLEGIPNEEFIPVLEKLAGSKKETPYTKSMREFLKLFKADETFRTQCYNAFSNYFVPSYSSKIDSFGTVRDEKTGENKKGFESAVYANNAENYVETQVDSWASQLFGKELTQLKSIEDLQNYITIQDEVFDSPEGIESLNSLMTLINNKLASNRQSADIIRMITTGNDNKTLIKLATENIKYRMDLGDLTYKFGGKNFYSMLKQNYVFTQLKNSKKYKNKWGVFTGVNFRFDATSKAEQELYKNLDPASYLLTNFQLYMNNWYIPQQMENKSTVVIVKGESKSKSDIAISVREEIKRQSDLIKGYVKELKSKDGIVKGFHIYDKKVPAEIESIKGFKNTPEFILSLVEKGTRRDLLPRAYQYINIVGANETLSTEEPVYNEGKTMQFIAEEVLDIKTLITELGLPNEILGKIFKVDLKNQTQVEEALSNFAISQYLNRMEMLAVINPELTKYKDFVDITKRGAGLLLAGPSHYNAGKPATFGTVVLKDIEYTIHKDTMERNSGDGMTKEQKKEFLKEIKATDGQSIETIGRRLDRHLRLGRASEDPNNDFYKQAELLQAYKDDDRVKIAQLNSGNMALMVDKTGGFDGKKYIKTSVFPLTRYFSSYEVPAGTPGAAVDTYNGKSYLPYPHRVQSHNQLNKLQALEVEVTNAKRAKGEIGKDQHIYFEAHFASAIKLGLSKINELDSDKYEYSEFGNGDYRLQQENPSGKDLIKDGTQLIQLIGAFLPDDIQFTGEFKGYSNKAELLNDMSSMLANLREFDRRMIPNSFKKLQLLGEQNGGLYVPFIKYLQDSKETSGSSDNDSEFLASKDGEFIYSQNMPHLINGYEQAFISYFNKNLFSQKTPGGKATLVSAAYSEVMEFNGEVISTWEFENKLTAEQRAQVTSRPLKCHKPGGDVENAYAEVILSEEYLEDILGITLKEYHNLNSEMKEKVRTILGFRIPTQSHHSMMPCKVVDFAPRHYGSMVVAPAEITYLSGADYDVDSLFFQRYGFYKNKRGKLGKVQLDADTYFSTIMENKIVKEYMQMNNPEIEKLKVEVLKTKARIKAYEAQLKNYEVNPPSDLSRIENDRKELESLEKELGSDNERLYTEKRRALTNILKTLGFPTTEKEFNSLDVKEQKNFIKDYSNNSLLSTRLNILTANFEGKFSPAIDKFQELYSLDEGKYAKYFPKAKQSQIYTSFSTFFRHYLNNYAGGRAIGASANGNKVFAHLHSTNSTLSRTLEKDLVRSISRNLFTNTNDVDAVDYKIVEVNGKLVFGDRYTDSKPDNLSSAVSMTVDNVKEQTLVKFNLNDKTMPLLTAAFGIGIGNNLMATFLLNPATKVFSQMYMKESSPFGKKKGVTMKNILSDILTSEEYQKIQSDYQITDGNLNDFLADATQDTDRKTEVLDNFINGKVKFENLNIEDRFFVIRQFALFELFSTISEISEDSFVVNTLLNLNKELGEQASDVDYVLARYEKAVKGDDPDGMPPSRFSFNYNIPSSVNANINSVYQAKEILDKNLLFYGEGILKVFENVDNICLNPPNSKLEFESRVDMKKEFMTFLTIKAYSKYNFEDINNFELVQGKLISMYEEKKDAILKYPFGQMLKPLNATKQYPFPRLGVDSFKKLDPRKKDDIMDSFAGMLIDPETKDFAMSVLSFIATHDNFRFIGQSSVSFMRPSIFNALNEVLKGTESNIGIENMFVNVRGKKQLDTVTVGKLLSPDGNFNTLFKDYLSFWFSDNRNSMRLSRLNSEMVEYKNGVYCIEGVSSDRTPLVTFVSKQTDFGYERMPLIFEGYSGKLAIYKPIRKPKASTSLKFYQLTNDESVNLIDSANKTVVPINDNTISNIIKTINSKGNLEGLEAYLKALSLDYDNLNPEISSAIQTKKSQLGVPVTQTTQPSLGTETAEQVYSQLGNKTQSKSNNIIFSNIKTKDGKYDRDANLKEAKDNGRVYSMETKSDLSFSNPWAHFNRTGTIKTNTTKEAVLNYIDWLTTDKFQDVKPERRKWILDVLKSGQLKGKPIQYYVELNEPSHATALDYLVNQYEWNKTTTQPPARTTTIIDNTNKPEFNKLPNKSATRTMTYAGIGSRETPADVLKVMTEASKYLDSIGYTLQTGFTFKDKETGLDEEGADKAFSDGSNNKILFGPSGIRRTVNGNTSLETYDNNVSRISEAVVKEIHPAPDRLKPGALKLMARNTNQIFGKNLDSTVDFVLFYAQETDNPLRPKGGTGQAVEMARRKGIPTINMANPNWRDQLKAVISKKGETSEGTSRVIPKTNTKKLNEMSPSLQSFVKAYFGADTSNLSTIFNGLSPQDKLEFANLSSTTYAATDIKNMTVDTFLNPMERESIFYMLKTGNSLKNDVMASEKVIKSRENALKIKKDDPAYFEKNMELIKQDVNKTFEEVKDAALKELGYAPGAINFDEKKTDVESFVPPVATGLSVFNYKGKEITTEFPLSQDQNNALASLIDFVNNPNKAVITLEGAAGTGKTTIIGYLQKYFNGLANFIYMAPTHAATAELAFATAKTGNKLLPATIQSSLTKDRITNLPVFTGKTTRKFGTDSNIIVVDESSMLGNQEIDDLLAAAKKSNVQVIFMGDEKQIPKVMPSAKDIKPLSKAFTDYDKVSLKYVHRTSNENILSLLGQMRESKIFNVPRPAQNTESLQFLDSFTEFKEKFSKDLLQDPENTVLITYTNKGVKDFNVEARATLGRTGQTVVGDIITGYLGYASKQIDLRDVANSIQYTITDITSSGSARAITVESQKLQKLSDMGIPVSPTANTVYYQMSRNDSLTFDDLTLEDYKKNNETVSSIFKELHQANEDFKNKRIPYPKLLDKIAGVAATMRKVSVGQNYIYNPATDKMEVYDDLTHKGINPNLKVEKDIDYGHAITIHKSQGTSIGNVYFDLSSVKNMRDLSIVDKTGNIVTTEKQALAYVGLSRSKNKLIVFDGGGQVNNVNLEQESEFPEDIFKPKETEFQGKEEELFNPWDNIPPTGGIPMAKLNRSLFGLPEPQDAGPRVISTDARNIVISKIKANFELYKNTLGIESVEQIDNMNNSEIATLIKNFCKI